MKTIRKIQRRLVLAWRFVWYRVLIAYGIARTPWREVPKGYRWVKLLTTTIVIILFIYLFTIIIGIVVAIWFSVGLMSGAAETAEQAMRNQTGTRRRRGPYW